MLFDLVCDNGEVWKWGTNSCSIYRPDGTKVYKKKWSTYMPQGGFRDCHFSDYPQQLEIILGERCNYNCAYCYQKGMRENGVGWRTGPKDVPNFLAMVEFAIKGVRQISFWGGEPLVYWKILVPLVAGLKKLYPVARMSIVTNGSLLDAEKIEWARKNLIGIAVSHDGPGTGRGHDVLDENKENLQLATCVLGDLFQMKPTAGQGCESSEKTRQWFREHGMNARINTRSVIRLVPEAVETKLDEKTLKGLEDSAYYDATHGRIPVRGYMEKIVDRRTPWDSPGECGAGLGEQISVNLNGDIFPCHADFYQGHKIGSLADATESGDFGVVKGFHSPYERKSCRECPYPIFCRGACPRLPPDAVVCAGRKAHAKGVMRAVLELLLGIKIVEIRPNGNEILPP